MMKMQARRLNVLAEPHPFLRKPVEKIEDPMTQENQQLIADMILTMREENGIGLAAIQVHENKRLIVVETKDGAIAFINPEIVSHSDKTEVSEEGCLSVPGQYAPVKRYLQVTVKSLDVEGTSQTHDANGLFARVLQHEIDHLNGILFIDKIEDFDRSEIPEAIAPQSI
jgi:peptide deformylase